MVHNKEKWCYLAIKRLSPLLRRITSTHDGDFYCLNCLHSFRTKTKLVSHKKVCKKKDFYNVLTPSKNTKILELNQCRISDKEPSILFADLKPLIKK